MRNPIRVKNLRMRFLPFYLVGLVLLIWVRPTPAEFVVGLVAVVVGAAVRTWGAGHLVKTLRLTVTGPYSRVRHPLYVGTLLCGSGISLMLGGWWSLVVLTVFLPWFFFVYFPRKEQAESGRLEALYGEEFTLYRAQVPALLPRFSPWTPPSEQVLGGASARRWSLDLYWQNNELGTLLALVACVAVLGLRVSGG